MKKKPPSIGKPHPAPAGWVQMDRQSLAAMNSLIRDNPTAGRILLTLAAYADRRGAVVASQATMARLVGVNRTTLWRGLKVLDAGNWVQLLRIGNATAVVLNARVAWADTREKIGQAIFSATVIGSADEQEHRTLQNITPLRKVVTLVPPEMASLVGSADDDQPDLPGVE